MNFPEYELTSIKFKNIENSLHGVFSELEAPDFLQNVISCVVPIEVRCGSFNVRENSHNTYLGLCLGLGVGIGLGLGLRSDWAGGFF